MTVLQLIHNTFPAIEHDNIYVQALVHKKNSKTCIDVQNFGVMLFCYSHTVTSEVINLGNTFFANYKDSNNSNTNLTNKSTISLNLNSNSKNPMIE